MRHREREGGQQEVVAHSPALLLISCRISGRLVTMPEPRGRKSLQEGEEEEEEKEEGELRRGGEEGGGRGGAMNIHAQISHDSRAIHPPPPYSSPAHEVLEHGALAGALAADHGYLRQVDGARHPEAGERILQLVDQRD